MKSTLALAWACALSSAFVLPWRACRLTAVGSGGALGAPGDALSGDDDEPQGLWRPEDMAYLQQRMERIRASEQLFGERRDEATMLYEMMTEVHPSRMIREFALGAGPEVRMAVQETVTGLLGSLPAWMMESEFTATGATLASMCLQLQLTGYVLRNAEYVQALRRMLDIRSRSSDEFRRAFERIDTDGSGFIETREVEALLEEVYGGVPPSFEVKSFVEFFDSNRDGKISWREFAGALGLRADDAAARATALPPADAGEGVPSPRVRGTVKLTLDDGRETEVDAAEYIDRLKAHAAELRATLSQLAQREAQSANELSRSLSAYLMQLPEEQRSLLSAGIDEKTVDAMRMIVDHVLSMGGDKVDAEHTVSMQREALSQLCVWQLVLGYRLREAEAKGAAKMRLGKR